MQRIIGGTLRWTIRVGATLRPSAQRCSTETLRRCCVSGGLRGCVPIRRNGWRLRSSGVRRTRTRALRGSRAESRLRGDGPTSLLRAAAGPHRHFRGGGTLLKGQGPTSLPPAPDLIDMRVGQAPCGPKAHGSPLRAAAGPHRHFARHVLHARHHGQLHHRLRVPGVSPRCVGGLPDRFPARWVGFGIGPCSPLSCMRAWGSLLLAMIDTAVRAGEDREGLQTHRQELSGRLVPSRLPRVTKSRRNSSARRAVASREATTIAATSLRCWQLWLPWQL